MTKTTRQHRRRRSGVEGLGRRWIAFLVAMMMFCAIGGAMAETAETADARQQILNQAVDLEAEKGKLRSVVVRVYSQEDSGQPREGEAMETAFLKNLSLGLEKMWALAEDETDELTPAELLKRYGEYTAAELETLAQYRESHVDDLLRDFLYHACIAWMDRQAAAVAEETNPVDALWQWNDARQEMVQAIFFLNRYYEVPVHPSYKSQMSSLLYEGAMLVSENTIETMLDQLGTEPLRAEDASSEADILSEEVPAEESAQTADDEVSSDREAAVAVEYGEEVWHEDPSGDYEFRVFDFDSEALSVQAEIQEKASGTVVARNRINLSVWEKYQKERQTLDTFYKVGEMELQDGKISFNLYANVRFDGRLFREIKGKISLKIPQKGSSAAAEDTQTASASETKANDPAFPEEAIDQDFSAVKVGDHLFMGYYEQDGNEENLREPIEWVVLSINKKKNIGIMVTVKGLEAVAYGTAGNTAAELEPGFNWSNSALREWLNGDFYNNAFTSEEKTRIRLASNVTKDPSGRFTTKDYVFLLSAEEAKRYMHTAKGMACEPTVHALEGLDIANGAIVENQYCLWWLRELTSAAKANRDGTLKKNTQNEAGYVSGTTGMHFYSRKIGLKIYQENMAVVRPAMWVKFGAE